MLHWTLKFEIFVYTVYTETTLDTLFSETINVRQSQLEKLYAGLKDLAEERRGKLDETHKLYQLIREVGR
jgi:spectrin beta